MLLKRVWGLRGNNIDRLRSQATQILLGVMGLSVGFQFVVFAYQQPADYARFALAFDICLTIEAIILVQTGIRQRAARAVCFSLLILTTGWMGSAYVRAFVRDTSASTTRILAARKVEELLDSGKKRIAVSNEPAPWDLPHMDLWRATLVQYPHLESGNLPVDVDSAVTLTDLRNRMHICGLFCTAPASWASKDFDVQAASQICGRKQLSVTPFRLKPALCPRLQLSRLNPAAVMCFQAHRLAGKDRFGRCYGLLFFRDCYSQCSCGC